MKLMEETRIWMRRMVPTIDPKTKKFVITKNNVRVPGFCIVYIRVNNNYDKCCCNNIIVNMKWRQKREKKNEFNIFKILKIL